MAKVNKQIIPTLSQAHARAIILRAAGLDRASPFGKGPQAVYKFIQHLGFLQIDTQYVVERAHHHAIFNRVPGYKREWLDQLQEDGSLYEFWTHVAGYMPTEHYRFSIPVQDSFRARRKPLTPTEAAAMRMVLDRIAREGPQRTSDFENDRAVKSSGWWDWRPSKVALERLHLEGKLLTKRDSKFHKVYDLTENLLPSGLNFTPPDITEYSRHVILRALKAFGIAHLKEIAFTSRYTDHHIHAEMEQLINEKRVLLVRVEGISKPVYTLPEYLNRKVVLKDQLHILSPFDVVCVFRHRLRDFFDFDYSVECFVPEAKRKYGYFALPLLYGQKFIGRMDSKVDRTAAQLIIKGLYFDERNVPDEWLNELARSLFAFSKFNGCKSIRLEYCNRSSAATRLRKLLV